MRWDMANKSPSRTNYFLLQRVAALVASLTKGPESLQLQWCHSCSILSGTIHSEGSETINLCTAGQDSHSLRLQGGFTLERCRAPEWLGEKFKLTFVGDEWHLEGPNSLSSDLRVQDTSWPGRRGPRHWRDEPWPSCGKPKP